MELYAHFLSTIDVVGGGLVCVTQFSPARLAGPRSLGFVFVYILRMEPPVI